MSFYPKRPRGRSEGKFGNTPSVCALGHSHRSKLEVSVCQILQLRERAGEMKLLQVEDHIYLTEARILYIADFRCLDTASGQEFLVEAKGYEAPTWPIKKRLYKAYGALPLEIWTGSHLNPRLTEKITPAGITDATCPHCGKLAA